MFANPRPGGGAAFTDRSARGVSCGHTQGITPRLRKDNPGSGEKSRGWGEDFWKGYAPQRALRKNEAVSTTDSTFRLHEYGNDQKCCYRWKCVGHRLKPVLPNRVRLIRGGQSARWYGEDREKMCSLPWTIRAHSRRRPRWLCRKYSYQRSSTSSGMTTTMRRSGCSRESFRTN